LDDYNEAFNLQFFVTYKSLKWGFITIFPTKCL
jgi:hypothetical protein